MVFGHIFISNSMNSAFKSFFQIQNILSGTILFYHKPRLRYIMLSLLTFIAVMELLGFLGVIIDQSTITGPLYVLYFFLISAFLYRKIFKSDRVGSEMLAAVFSGFIILCLIFSFVFMSIEINQPGSFSNLDGNGGLYQDLQYFSFITALTIGYGDIFPTSIIAKNGAVLLGLVGNFYTVFITAIVIGKFLKEKEG